MNITYEEIVQAFEDWEVGYRLDPAKFMTREELGRASTATTAVLRADWFNALLRQRGVTLE